MEPSNADQQLKSIVASDLGRLLATIDTDVKRRLRARDSIKRLLAAWERGDLEYASKFLIGPSGKTLAEVYGDAQVSLERLRLALARSADSAQEDLMRQLEDYCSTHGLHLDGRGSSYEIDSILSVVFDTKKRGVKVGNQFVQRFDWGKIEAALDQEIERLWGRPADPTAVQDRLLGAYHAVASTHPNPTKWVRLMDVYQELKKQVEKENPRWKTKGRLSAYYRDEFCVDLSRLMAAQMAGKLNGRELEFSAIRDPRLTFRVPLPDRTASALGFMRPLDG
jgi:hypothetical protein